MRKNQDRTNRPRIFAFALLLAGILAAHATALPGRASHLSGTAMPDPASDSLRFRLEAPDPAPDSLRLSFEAPDTVVAGQAVQFTFRIENVSGASLDIHLLGRTIAFDVIVRGGDGEVAWRRMEGQVIPQILRLETLPPEGALVLEATWKQRSNDGGPVATGAYSVTAELFTDGEPLRSPVVRLRIVDR